MVVDCNLNLYSDFNWVEMMHYKLEYFYTVHEIQEIESDVSVV
jgi:hypothetical protein